MTQNRRDIDARFGAFLFLGGAFLTAAVLLLPHTPERDATAFIVLSALQLLAALGILSMPASWRRHAWLRGLIVVVGIAAVTGAVYFNGERLGGPTTSNEVFYVWPALYVGYFFSTRAIVASILLICSLYAGLLTTFDVDPAAALVRWIATTSVVTGAALALRMLRHHVDNLLARLRETARTDGLTTLLNRRGFDERFVLELERARRLATRVSVIIGDLDHFKSVNDRLGHPAGDAVLIEVGRALACRSVDTVARIGGEEFALLLPGTDTAGALRVTTRLQAELAAIAQSDGTSLTMSFGVVEYLVHGETAEELMASADEALYAAKALGRNRTMVGGPACREALEAAAEPVGPVPAPA